MATDAARVVDHLGPLNGVLASWLWLDHFIFAQAMKFTRRNISWNAHTAEMELVLTA
jgi:hypothetical protein